MKNLTLFIILHIWGIIYSSAQSTEKVNYKLVPVPLKYSDTIIYNFATKHVAEYNTLFYKDTNVANAFFRLLAKRVDPKKVVLIVEDVIYNNSVDKIKEDSSKFFTTEMKQLGFTKWVSGDNRPYSHNFVKTYYSNLEYLYKIFSRYYKKNIIEGKFTKFGLPLVNYQSNGKKIPDATEDSIISALPAVQYDIVFENNLKRLYKIIKAQGYIPIVVAGYSHVQMLDFPYLRQVTSKDTELKCISEIFYDIDQINQVRFILNDFIKNHNVIITTK